MKMVVEGEGVIFYNNFFFLTFSLGPVSYTHLDVYKRQTFDRAKLGDVWQPIRRQDLQRTLVERIVSIVTKSKRRIRGKTT